MDTEKKDTEKQMINEKQEGCTKQVPREKGRSTLYEWQDAQLYEWQDARFMFAWAALDGKSL